MWMFPPGYDFSQVPNTEAGKPLEVGEHVESYKYPVKGTIVGIEHYTSGTRLEIIEDGHDVSYWFWANEVFRSSDGRRG